MGELNHVIQDQCAGSSVVIVIIVILFMYFLFFKITSRWCPPSYKLVCDPWLQLYLQ